ncbi:GrpE-domain-containing protein [Dipodascopsis uninucleata]
MTMLRRSAGNSLRQLSLASRQSALRSGAVLNASPATLPLWTKVLASQTSFTRNTLTQAHSYSTTASPSSESSSDKNKEESTSAASENASDKSVESEVEKKIKELEEALSAKAKEAADLKDKFLRQVADFRNLQETTKREVQNSRDFAIQKFARDLLDSVDNLERALATIPEEKRSGDEQKDEDQELMALYDGVKMTQQILEQTLKRHGLEKIDPLGEKFDPHKHEATFEIDQPDKEPGTVFFVQQTGFTLNNRVLRAAKVGVVKQK